MDVITASGSGGTAAAPGSATACARVTRLLLVSGLAAGLLYLTAGLAQALTRDGFDLGRHALSLLENGPLGWIQISNFLITGLLAIACAVGIRRVLGRRPGRRLGPAAGRRLRGRAADGRGFPGGPGRRLPARHPVPSLPHWCET